VDQVLREEKKENRYRGIGLTIWHIIAE